METPKKNSDIGDAGNKDISHLISKIASLEQLLETYEKTVVEQADKVFSEVIERRRIQKELMESEEKFHKIAATALDAIIMMDNDGNISFWNKAAENIFGYTNDEVMHKSLHLLIIPERFRENHSKGFGNFKGTGEGPLIGKTVEVPALRSDGKEFPIELSLSGVKINDRWCAIGIVRDITKRREAEEELHRLNTDLKILYNVSQAVGRTFDMNEFLPDVLRTLAGGEIFPVEIKIALFLVKEEKMKLAALVGLPENTIEPCAEIHPGECLCGTALAKGEIIISKDSFKDGWHATCHPEIAPHGRIVVPLKAVNKVIGLLSLYIPPDTNPTDSQIKLLSSIGSSIGIALSNAQLYEDTKSFSLHDPLTGLANRRFLRIQMDKSFDLAKRYSQALSVIMIDVDHFKEYNDTYGHIEGDRMLARIAGVLLKEARKADYVFRYGGEEFLIILPETDSEMAVKAAERLRRSVESEAGITISLGVAAITGFVQGKEELIANSDKALYLAKQNGRNRVELYER